MFAPGAAMPNPGCYAITEWSVQGPAHRVARTLWADYPGNRTRLERIPGVGDWRAVPPEPVGPPDPYSSAHGRLGAVFVSQRQRSAQAHYPKGQWGLRAMGSGLALCKGAFCGFWE